MFLGILTLLTALTISAVAIYYSVAGLVAIFAAAALPIMIMGGALEIAKLVTAVWLHRYWKQAAWWLKSYLTLSVVVLMFITSMGIFGFLSKAHIEQTSASQESVAQVERINTEIGRLNGIIVRAEEKIIKLESSGSSNDENIQTQIDKEQGRIDKAFERIQPAIEQQNKIIANARKDDSTRTKPYEDQLNNIQNEITRLETTAREYENKIASLTADTSAVDPLLEQIDAIEKEIIRVTNQVNSGERDQIRAGQAIIGVTSDGAFGNNTRKALVAWVAAQRERITQIQGEISKLRQNATSTVDAERTRLAGIVKDIRENQIPALKDRELTMLGKIDEVRATESPVIKTARDEIQRLRESAEEQVKNSQALIERLRSQLSKQDKTKEIDNAIDEQNLRIKNANNEIDTLTEEKYKLEAENRKLEAEVGPVKYIAEFVYGETANETLLEEAVRWVILIIIFVFDPLAVLLLIASQYTFEFYREKRQKIKQEKNRAEYERARAEKIMANPGYTVAPFGNEPAEEKTDETSSGPNNESTDRQSENGRGDNGIETNEFNTNIHSGEIEGNNANDRTDNAGGSDSAELSESGSRELTPEQEARKKEYEEKDKEDLHEWQEAKRKWKDSNPDVTIKQVKNDYIQGKIEEVPWEKYIADGLAKRYIMKDNNEQVKKVAMQEGYEQNAEQSSNTIWQSIQDRDKN
jgi:hypothetical protein